MNKKLKVGLYGNNGHQIYEKLKNNQYAELVAVCNVSEEFMQFCIDNNINVYRTLDELILDSSAELVSLCSPERIDQEADAMKCLCAGKHVYAEKPATFSEDGLERLLNAAKEHGCEFHEMADSIFVEPYWTARKLVRSGKIGEVVQVYVQKSYPLNLNSRPQNETTDGGLIRWVGIHAVRFVEHITGLKVCDIKAVQTRLGTGRTDGLYTASSWVMRLSGGAVASACINYLNPKGFGQWGNESIRIFGTEGMLEIVDGGRKTHIYTNDADEGKIDFSNTDCEDFFDLLAKHLLFGDEMPITEEDELHPLRVVIRAFESAVEQES